MGTESQTNEQPGEEALLELGFGPDPPSADLRDQLCLDAPELGADLASDATCEDAKADDASEADSLESAIEADPALVPAGASAFLVAPAVLDPQEVEALLSGLHSLLEESSAAAANALATDALSDQQKDSGYEPDAKATGCDRRHSQFPSLAWLFPNHAGIGRSARHQQSNHIRARQRFGKKAGPAPRPSQGSLFGDHR